MTTTFSSPRPAAAKTKPAPAYQSVNPFDGKVVKTFLTLTDRQLEEKLATATRYFETWRHTTYAKRAIIVAKAAEILHAKANEFAQIMTHDEFLRAVTVALDRPLPRFWKTAQQPAESMSP